MSTVITVENLGKRYTLRHQQREQYTALRDVITNGVASLGKKLIHPFRRSLPPDTLSLDPAVEDFWALKDVSFEVKQGDRIGIIGRNGAGKSTLLKLLSRITEPTTGSVRIKGRVASLLEVGTGFHPELTGRENIFLNGAILGMGRAEIKEKFDEIVDFAEIEKFLDTPVKRYSSGMYVRLAFAVAAHLEPEILIVDEVLAVGDAQFQKKCLGKMEDVSAKEGRTVLFVSHNMSAVQSLCNRGILLNSGKLHHDGSNSDVIHAYNNLLNSSSASLLDTNKNSAVICFNVVNLKVESKYTPESSLDLEIRFHNSNVLQECYLNLVLEDSESRAIIHSRTDMLGACPTIAPGYHTIRIHIPRLSIRAGVYTAWFRLYSNKGAIFEILDSERIMLEVDGPQVSGMVDVACQWTLDDTVLRYGMP